MPLEIITLEIKDDGGKSAPGLLNWKLNDVLLSSSPAAAVVLPAARAGDHALLEFLAEWSARFTKANKQLYIVPKDGNSTGRIDVFHPDRVVKYAASVAELKQTESSLSNPAPSASAPAGTMAMGAMVTTSGEYVCTTCGKARMWLKGDTAAACDNLECSDAQTGWQMTIELF
jgi:hypothetical protein